MRTLGILQARFSSSRLPGKVLMPILGAPMLFRQMERLGRCREIDKLVVATSVDQSDDELVIDCEKRSIEVCRGSLNDVLERFFCVASAFQPFAVVRLTGDCPLADPQVIDSTINYFFEKDFDYVSNCDPPTFPDGLDVEVFRFECLAQAHKYAILPSEREHVTPYIRNRSDVFSIGNYYNDTDLSHLRWTVDEPEDFEFVRNVYEKLYPINRKFSMDDVLDLIDRHPELKKINSKFQRNEGSIKSALQDREFLARNRNVISV